MKPFIRLYAKPAAWIAVATLATIMTGCTNLSGLDATSNYSCPAPPGVVCKPMSEVYRSTNQPRTVSAPADAVAESDAKVAMRTSLPPATFLPGETRPLRSQPKVLRIWVAPYEDSDGDLHEEHRMYLQVDAGRWMVEHHRARIQNAYLPIRAPSITQSKADTSKPADLRAAARPDSPQNQTDVFDSAPDTNVGAVK